MGTSGGRVHRGRVRSWFVDDGWGVVESGDFADPIWVHYSMVTGVRPGAFRQLQVDDEVELTVEHAEQDEFRLRAIWVRSVG
ncbi:cold-shock protein [Amycolatopsis alba]|uniref:Cold-shock protein n=1 Tax=Amycolatopsis alba DSM 44262 TaxID=1125972 RepID=A0A229RPT9_AMYAL|nr:cold shock domain-containing protein [Amycolatopsis alba]OXM48565.1 cold-shock protein [Amycolatopsis alba DSM 44262]